MSHTHVPPSKSTALTFVLLTLAACLFCGIARAAESGEGTSTAAPTASPSTGSPLFGKWKGLVCSPNLTVVELEIAPGTEPGTLRAHSRSYRAARKGEVFRSDEIKEEELEGKYDDFSRSFVLLASHWTLRAVLDPQSGWLLGMEDDVTRGMQTRHEQFTSDTLTRWPSVDDEAFPFYIFARGPEGDKLVDQVLEKVLPPAATPPPARTPRPSRTPRPRYRNGKRFTPPAPRAANLPASPTPRPENGTAPSVEKIVEWASPLKRDDLVDARNALIPRYQRLRLISNLFRDTYFASYFGKPYDQLDPADFKAIEARFKEDRPPAGNPPIRQPALRYEYHELAPLLERPSGAVILGLYWHRNFPHWVTDIEKRLQNMTPEADSIAKINFTEITAACEAHLLWPEERQQLHQKILEARTRIAAGVINLRADRAIADSKTLNDLKALIAWPDVNKDVLQYVSAETAAPALQRIDQRAHSLAGEILASNIDALIQAATDLPGARALADWEKAQPSEVMQLMSEKDRAEAAARTNQRLDALLSSLLAKDEAAYPINGHGMEALLAGNRWFQRLTSTYDFASGRPPVREALEHLAKRRARDLAEAAPAIVDELKKQTTVEGVSRVEAHYLAVPGDGQTPAAAKVLAAAGERKKALERDAVLARYSPHERQWLKPDGTIAIPSHVPEPDEDDLRVAIVRTLEMLGGERVGPFKVHWSNNPLVKQLGVYLIIDVNKVEKFRCAPSGGGFAVEYRAHLSFDWPEDYKRLMTSQPSFGGTVLQALTEQINGPQGTKLGQFELSERGWWSPSMRDGWTVNY
jgi:hypothetical protein